MKKFLYWKQIQDRLSLYAAEGEERHDFYSVVRELWAEGKFYSAEDLPAVCFSEWDVLNLDWFDEIYNEVPVSLESFYHDFEHDISGEKSAESVIAPEVVVLRIANDQAPSVHRHEFFEVDYVMRGEAQLALKTDSRTLHTGQFCFLSPKLKHDVIPDSEAQVLTITISASMVEQTLYRLLNEDSVLAEFFHSALDSDKTGYVIVSVPEEKRIREILRGMLHEYFSHEKFSTAILPDHLVILFAFILRQCGNQYELYGENTDHHGMRTILSALEYLREHYRELTLNELAERFNYEPSYLGKLIKGVTGKNYTEIIRELRIDEAKRLLRSTKLTTGEISERIGYNDRIHFYRNFQSVVGVTPGEYRKQKDS